jgi:hypothetical protein
MVVGSGGAAAVHAYIEATKAVGAIVHVTPEAFQDLVARAEKPLIVHARGGMFRRCDQYLMSWRGLIFFTKSDAPIDLSPRAELIEARKIAIPDL